MPFRSIWLQKVNGVYAYDIPKLQEKRLVKKALAIRLISRILREMNGNPSLS